VFTSGVGFHSVSVWVEVAFPSLVGFGARDVRVVADIIIFEPRTP
jgi:hypothetical protein